MKILFISGKNPFGSGPFGGAETSIGVLAKELGGIGQDVTLLCSDQATPENAASLHNLISFEEFRKFRRSSRNVTSEVTNISLALKLRTISAKDFDLIYCSYEPNVLAALVDYRCLWDHEEGKSPKLVLRIAGEHWAVLCDRNPSLKRRYQRWFSAFDSVNFLSKELLPRSVSMLKDRHMFVEFDRPFVLDVGSAKEIQEIKNKKRGMTRPFKITSAGRFSNYQKRQDLLIDAVALLPNPEDFAITFFGEGSERLRLQQKVTHLQLDGSIKFYDFTSQESLWEAFTESDLICHFADFEGVCKTVIEAMSVGAPVLCSNIPPLNTIISDKTNGFLVENDPTAIGNILSLLSSDMNLLNSVTASAVKTINENFSARKNAEQYLKIFEELV